MVKDKCVVMLSGGLDSRLAVKLMQEKGFDVIGIYFKFPFSKDYEEVLRRFAKEQKFELKVFDGCKGELLQEYLKVIKEPIHGRGSGINPCIDCRLFMLKRAKAFADKEGIDLVATGEVLGQRPMSQHKKALDIAAKDSELNERLIRPVMEAGARGRRREFQIKLANKFKIDYPNAGGGCMLCEKNLINRLKYLLKRGLNDKEINLLGIGRHFVIDEKWIVLGRDEKESLFIEELDVGEKIIPSGDAVGPSAVIVDVLKGISKADKDIKEKVKKLVKSYSKGGDRSEFKEYLL